MLSFFVTRCEFFLVAPELYGQDQRDVYLPAGEWINVFTGETVQGGTTITVDVTMAQIPVFYNANTTSVTAASVYADMQVIIDQINAVELP